MKDLPHRKKAAYAKVKDGQIVGCERGDERKSYRTRQTCHAMTFEFCPVQCGNQ